MTDERSRFDALFARLRDALRDVQRRARDSWGAGTRRLAPLARSAKERTSALTARTREGASALAGRTRDRASAMADRYHERLPARRRRIVARRRAVRARRAEMLESGPSNLLGLPAPMLIVGLVAAIVLGGVLAYSLTVATRTGPYASGMTDDIAADGSRVARKVVTESTLGIEVQQMMDAGSMQATADFDVSACLQQQGIKGRVLAIEPITWGAKLAPAWLVVHTTAQIADVRDMGGPVGVSVIKPKCGEGEKGGPMLWNGATVLGARP